MEELNLRAVADRTGASVDQLLEWGDAGLVRREEAEWARLVCFLVHRGFSPTPSRNAERNHPGLLDEFVGHRFPAGRFPEDSVAEAAERSGLDVSLVDRVWQAAGPRELGNAADEDVDALRAVATALATGLPENAVIETVRVYADALRRVAEAEVRQLRSRGGR